MRRAVSPAKAEFAMMALLREFPVGIEPAACPTS